MIRTKRAKQAKFFADINVTPFTDVCLVLLIIFMVTAPSLLRESNIKMNLPRAATSDAQLPSSITVRITKDQQIMVNTTKVTFATMGQAIKGVHDKYGTRLLVVKADEGVPYKLVIRTIDIARQVGVNQIALATSQTDRTPSE